MSPSPASPSITSAQVHDHFDDKTVLVIGAGKMGALTLKHLRSLKPERILVTNRSPEKAHDIAKDCGGIAIPWEQLDDALVEADIVLSTTGAPEPIMTRRRFDGILARRNRGTMVILDIAVPRDFDPSIHDGDRACLFNVDDLKRIQEQTIKERQQPHPPGRGDRRAGGEAIPERLAPPQERPDHRPAHAG